MENNNKKNQIYKDLTTEELIEIIEHKNLTINTLKDLLFRKKSEKLKEDPSGMKPLFDEVEVEAEEEKKQEKEGNEITNDDASANGLKRKKGVRKPLPKDLPRERIEHDLEESEKFCPIHKTALTKIGEKSSEKLEIIPAQIKVIENITFTYKCSCCSKESAEEHIICSKTPSGPIPKSFATPSLLAYIATSKYQDALPLYRQEGIFCRYGIDLNRTSMARWMIKCAILSRPLINLLKDEILEIPVIGCDETPVQVLSEPNRSPEQKSYMWVVLALTGNPIVLFEYHTGRSAKTAAKLLQDYDGKIVCDGLKSYDSYAKDNNSTLTACMAHIRRKFYQAEKAVKRVNPKAKSKATDALDLIRSLYKIEKESIDEPPDKKLIIRQKESKPIMSTFKSWLLEQNLKVTKKSTIGRAITYALDQWEKMNIFLDDPLVPIDNNPTERAIRPFVIQWHSVNAGVSLPLHAVFSCFLLFLSLAKPLYWLST